MVITDLSGFAYIVLQNYRSVISQLSSIFQLSFVPGGSFCQRCLIYLRCWSVWIVPIFWGFLLYFWGVILCLRCYLLSEVLFSVWGVILCLRYSHLSVWGAILWDVLVVWSSFLFEVSWSVWDVPICLWCFDLSGVFWSLWVVLTKLTNCVYLKAKRSLWSRWFSDGRRPCDVLWLVVVGSYLVFITHSAELTKSRKGNVAGTRSRSFQTFRSWMEVEIRVQRVESCKSLWDDDSFWITISSRIDRDSGFSGEQTLWMNLESQLNFCASAWFMHSARSMKV